MTTIRYNPLNTARDPSGTAPKIRPDAIGAVKPETIIAVDVETTGLSPLRGHRVIEIAAVKIVSGQPGEAFHSLIDCGQTIPDSVQRINGITDEMLIGQPKPETVFAKFRDFVGNSTLLAHNAPFDGSFIRHEFGRLGWGFRNRMRCTLEMSRQRFPRLPDHRLETVFRHLFPDSVKDTQAHRALDDARMAAWIWVAMEDMK
jgi:DNA polymerase III subunit epsilon